ncbi:MAG: sigma-70 family RNA polymerase sigma factor [Candidatus Aenigmatarchaeota archaeon]
MERRSLEIYMKELANSKPLAPEEELELLIRAKKGDEKARERIIISNLRFVITVAKDYISAGMPLEDLISAGNLGLMKAIEKFDLSKNVKFISYAVWWIRAIILKEINENLNIVKFPASTYTTMVKKNKEVDRLISEHLNGQDIEFDAIDLNYPVNSDYKLYISLNSTYEHPKSGREIEMEDLIEDADANFAERIDNIENLKSLTEQVLSSLSVREREILKMYFGIDYPNPISIDSIAKIFSVTQERVRQLVYNSLAVLRKQYNSTGNKATSRLQY